MKRLSLILAVAALAAGCASQPPGRPGPNTRPAQANPPGQTQPLPGRSGPGYDTSAPQTSGTTPSDQRSAAQNGSGSGAPTAKAPPRSAEAVSSPAVMSLMGRADTLANGGHMGDAAATLERALDLDPRNPFIYQRLAAVRLAQGQAGQAEQLAMKSNSVSDNNPFVEAGNWRLIAEARHSQGDDQGASAARAQAVNFRQSASQYGP